MGQGHEQWSSKHSMSGGQQADAGPEQAFGLDQPDLVARMSGMRFP